MDQHRRKEVCWKLSFGTQASFDSRSCEDVRSQNRRRKRMGKFKKKSPARDVKKARAKSEVYRQAKEEGETVHFANLMDLCHPKNADLSKHLQKYKERVVHQEGNVKDEEGHRAVFTEQGASASQMAAAKFLDTISKLPGMAGETSDAISAYSQVKMTEAPRLSRLPKEECPEMWIRLPPRQRLTSWNNIDDLVGPLERNLKWSPPVASRLWWRKFEEVLFEKEWEKGTNLGMSSRAQRARIILAGFCGWENDWESSRTWDPCGKCYKRKLISEIQRHQ